MVDGSKGRIMAGGFCEYDVDQLARREGGITHIAADDGLMPFSKVVVSCSVFVRFEARRG